MRPLFAFAICLTVTSLAWGQAEITENDLQPKIDELIKQLDADRFSERQKAQDALLELGAPAIKALQEAAESDNVQLRNRVQRLLKELMLKMTRVQTVSEPELADVASITLSDDGRFAYSAAHTAGAICVFSRDAETGKLTTIQKLKDPFRLRGVVSIRLSPDGRLAVACCYSAKSIVLFKVDAESGELTRTDLVNTVDEQRLAFPIEAIFSDDSKFVYALDPSIRLNQATGAVIALEVQEDNTLEWKQTNTGLLVDLNGEQVSCFNGARGIAMHPDGKRFFVIAEMASTISALDRDAETGETKIIYTATDGTDGVRGLSGGFSLACSRDGEYVYTTSGRFRGDNTVGVFRIAPNGGLRVTQEFIDGENDLNGFEGGNEIVLTKDGNYLFAAGTRSSTVAAFKRETSDGKLMLLLTESVGDSNPGPAGLAVSADGRFLYIASESDGEILVYQLHTPSAKE